MTDPSCGYLSCNVALVAHADDVQSPNAAPDTATHAKILCTPSSSLTLMDLPARTYVRTYAAEHSSGARRRVSGLPGRIPPPSVRGAASPKCLHGTPRPARPTCTR